MNGKGLYAGIDSGSTSTDVVIIDRDKNIIAQSILPTGAGAAAGADRALDEALAQAGLSRSDINATVTTGYGRTAVGLGDQSITEIPGTSSTRWAVSWPPATAAPPCPWRTSR